MVITRETPLRDIFYPEGMGMPDSELMKAVPKQRLAVVLPSFGTEMLDAVNQDLQESTNKILQMTPVDILVQGWNKYREVAKLLADSKQKPNDPILKPLVKHTIKSIHHPYVELSLDNAPIWKVEFEITASLDADGVMLKIQNGRILQLSSGTAMGKFKLSSSGFTLAEKSTNRFNLRGDIRFGPETTRADSVVSFEKMPAAQPCLVAVSGEFASREFPLIDYMVIGRSPKSIIRLSDMAVSHYHAQVSRTGTQWLIQDMGSSGGTYVNDRRVDSAILRHGDLIRIGHSEFEFRE